MQFLANLRPDLLRRTNRNGRFYGDHRIAGYRPTDRSGDFDYGVRIGTSVLIGRSSYGNKYDIGSADAGRNVRREMQPSGPDIPFDDLLQPGLVDRNLSLSEKSDLRSIGIHTAYVDSCLR